VATAPYSDVPLGSSIQRGDRLYATIEVVREHLARQIITRDTRGVLNRVIELGVPVKVLSTSTAQPGAVLLLDQAEEVCGHAPTMGGATRDIEGPEVLNPGVTRPSRGEWAWPGHPPLAQDGSLMSLGVSGRRQRGPSCEDLCKIGCPSGGGSTRLV
jgi:hypothetical protein